MRLLKKKKETFDIRLLVISIDLLQWIKEPAYSFGYNTQNE